MVVTLRQKLIVPVGKHGKGSEAGNKEMKNGRTSLEDSIRVRETGETDAILCEYHIQVCE